MTARQFLESSWFKLLWRGVIVVGIPALSGVSAYAGYTLNSVYGQQAELTREVAAIQETQTDRADVADERAVINDEFQAEMTAKVEKIDDAIASVQLDVARIVGIVSEMQRRDVAVRFRPD